MLMTLGQGQEMTFTNTHIPLLTQLVVSVYHLPGHRQLQFSFLPIEKPKLANDLDVK